MFEKRHNTGIESVLTMSIPSRSGITTDRNGDHQLDRRQLRTPEPDRVPALVESFFAGFSIST
jgi:hypothetical protein